MTPSIFWVCLLPLIVGAGWVALCGASRRWRVGVLLLELMHVSVVHAVMVELGKPVPLAPLLWGVACAGLFPECFRRCKSREEDSSWAETDSEPDADAQETDKNARKFVNGLPPQTLQDPVEGPATTATESGESESLGSVEAPEIFEMAKGDSSQEAPANSAGKDEAQFHESEPEGSVDETPGSVPPEPLREECSVMHCELSNHAALVNAMPPVEFAKLINEVLGIFESMVEARGGLCDRLSSDGMRAFFRGGALFSSHAESAVRCALAIRARLDAVSERCELDSGHELDLRFGINSGPMLVAFFGSGPRGGLSVAGESAEWGGRLAGANLLYGSKILLGTRTGVLTLDCVETRPIDLLQRHLPPEPPEEVHELLALRGTLPSDALERLVRYREGVDHFRARRWKQAAAALRAARPFRQNDDAIDLLLHRISEQESLADFAVDGHGRLLSE